MRRRYLFGANYMVTCLRIISRHVVISRSIKRIRSMWDRIRLCILIIMQTIIIVHVYRIRLDQHDKPGEEMSGKIPRGQVI